MESQTTNNRRTNQMDTKPKGLVLTRRPGQEVVFKRDRLMVLAKLLETTPQFARLRLSLPGIPDSPVVAVVRFGEAFAIVVQVTTVLRFASGSEQLLTRGITGNYGITAIGGTDDYCAFTLTVPEMGSIKIGIVPRRSSIRMIIDADDDIQIVRAELGGMPSCTSDAIISSVHQDQLTP